MRIYTLSLDEGFKAVAPEVPGTWSHGKTGGQAIEACRQAIAQELAAYERLGKSLEVTPGVVIMQNWEASGPAVFPEDLLPSTRSWVRAILQRIEEIRAEMDHFLDSLSPEKWDWHREGHWSVRAILDHITSAQWESIDLLEPWPLDPLRAQAWALDDLYDRLLTQPERWRTQVREHFGLNVENGWVRWTPRKVLRVTREQQQAWLAYLQGRGDRPVFPNHRDDLDDTEPPQDEELQALLDRGAELLEGSASDPTARGWLAILYRYYSTRLRRWSGRDRERWEAIWDMSRHRLLGLSDTELALVRASPMGDSYETVHSVMSQMLGHLKGHFGQMERTIQELRTGG